MKSLKCEERSCLYNSSLFCQKNTIAIDENSICASYTLKTSVDYKVEFAHDEVGHCPSINCSDCECKYNKQKACHANEIVVARQAFQNARCLTFKPRR